MSMWITYLPAQLWKVEITCTILGRKNVKPFNNCGMNIKIAKCMGEVTWCLIESYLNGQNLWPGHATILAERGIGSWAESDRRDSRGHPKGCIIKRMYSRVLSTIRWTSHKRRPNNAALSVFHRNLYWCLFGVNAPENEIWLSFISTGFNKTENSQWTISFFQ